MGLSKVTIGVQGLSEEVRRNCFNRTDSNSEIIDALEFLNDLGIEVRVDLIVSNPYEDYSQEALSFLLKLRSLTVGISTYALTYLPKTRITERDLKEGLIGKERMRRSWERGYSYASLDF